MRLLLRLGKSEEVGTNSIADDGFANEDGSSERPPRDEEQAMIAREIGSRVRRYTGHVQRHTRSAKSDRLRVETCMVIWSIAVLVDRLSLVVQACPWCRLTVDRCANIGVLKRLFKRTGNLFGACAEPS
ncbi:MAG: hypothetical protein DWQ31_16300 [Planctomycetota bacterium]|nr:MAG: hypothetical protein DWQ31_16300 [Planctomycetota bacterium]